jgi:hypothetical protein
VSIGDTLRVCNPPSLSSPVGKPLGSWAVGSGDGDGDDDGDGVRDKEAEYPDEEAVGES